MKVMVIGHGAREHVMCEAVTKSAELYTVMKSLNPGIVQLSKEYSLMNESEGKEIARWAKSKGIDLALIGPEGPEADGVGDELEAGGIKVASPTQEAAKIETSKEFMRELLDHHNINANPKFGVFESENEAKRFVKELNCRVAIKPIGLTGGKGVSVYPEHFDSVGGAMERVSEIINEKVGGYSKVLIEEKMEGEEFTLQAFCDGKSLLPTPPVQDHKRLLEGDCGVNTGGMGSYSQADGLLPFLNRAEREKSVEILQQVVDGLSKEGIRYKGAIYGQFMLTAEGPKVTEINARWGDPESMNVLPLLKSDFVELCFGIVEGRLSQKKAEFEPMATVCKYLVPQGYGIKPQANEEITVEEDKVKAEGARLYYAAVNRKNGKIFTTSSRSLAVLGLAKGIEEAEEIAERGSKWVKGKLFMRHDIGKRGLIEKRINHMLALRKK
ncbi:MAG TPA: phosphoribosylamine--glycine ligase [Thermoplasmata archaeon]|nr:phosphoribosylamine--glycine ligase [Thermoplasmata archaeon]